jgi:Patatin-like phospholipase
MQKKLTPLFTPLFAILFLLLTFIGCSVIAPSRLVYTQPIQSIPVHKKLHIYDDGDYFLALAISSGGSRSAVWSAAVIKELFAQVKLDDGRSILDEVDYISSVSAGSLSSAYYCIKKPPGDTTNVEKYNQFFDKFIKDMSRNIEGNVIMKPGRWYRLFLPAMEKTYFLKKDFDRYYFSNLTFDYIHERNKRGEAPALIINGTVLDSGKKFLYTTLPSSNFNIYIDKMLENLKSAGIAKSNISLDENIYSVMFAEDIGLSIRDMEVSWAVASSISSPLIFGPIVLKDSRMPNNKSGTYYHITNGGLTDSLGLETIVQLLNSRINLRKKNYRGGMVIIIDAGHRIDPKDSVLLKNFGRRELAARTKEIYSGREKELSYLTVMFAQGDPKFKNIKFVYISPYLAEDPDIITKIKDTPTRFKITVDSVKNLETAAKEVVGTVKDGILRNYEGK